MRSRSFMQSAIEQNIVMQGMIVLNLKYFVEVNTSQRQQVWQIEKILAKRHNNNDSFSTFPMIC